MPTSVLFVQGGSSGAYDADARLAESLRRELGPDYQVHYPAMPDEGEPDYATWKQVILDHLQQVDGRRIVVGHSIGGSVLIKLLVEMALPCPIVAAFSIAAPFWHDHHFWRWDEVTLQPDSAERFPPELPLFLYHGAADGSVPISHLQMYARALPRALVRALAGRDHQLNHDLTDVARDIQGLSAA